MPNDESVEVEIVKVSNLEKFIRRIKNIVLPEITENNKANYQYFFRGENAFYPTSCLPNLFRYTTGNIDNNIKLDVICNINDATMLKDTSSEFKYLKNKFVENLKNNKNKGDQL